MCLLTLRSPARLVFQLIETTDANPFVFRTLGIIRAGRITLMLMTWIIQFGKLGATGSTVIMIPRFAVPPVRLTHELLPVKMSDLIETPVRHCVRLTAPASSSAVRAYAGAGR